MIRMMKNNYKNDYDDDNNKTHKYYDDNVKACVDDFFLDVSYGYYDDTNRKDNDNDDTSDFDINDADS